MNPIKPILILILMLGVNILSFCQAPLPPAYKGFLGKRSPGVAELARSNNYSFERDAKYEDNSFYIIFKDNVHGLTRFAAYFDQSGNCYKYLFTNPNRVKTSVLEMLDSTCLKRNSQVWVNKFDELKIELIEQDGLIALQFTKLD